MVEKEIETVPDTILVSMVTDNPRSSDHTVGAAIEIMEENLARSGIKLTVNANNKGGGEETEGKEFALPGKLARFWLMVSLGITHAFDTGTATQGSVGEISTMEALLPDNVVALYLPNTYNFLRIWGETAVAREGEERTVDALPIEWDLERSWLWMQGEDVWLFLIPTVADSSVLWMGRVVWPLLKVLPSRTSMIAHEETSLFSLFQKGQARLVYTALPRKPI
jgi:hypothetical protein